MSEPWTGAWRWVTEGRRGRPTVASTRYCYMAVAEGRTSLAPGDESDAGLAELFRGVTTGGAGVIVSPIDGDESLQTNTNFVGTYPTAASASVLRQTVMDGDNMLQRVLGPDREVMAEHSYVRISDAGSSELAGAWELRADGWSGLLILTDSQYQYLITDDDRPADASPDSTDEVLAGLCRSTFGQAGAYRVDGNALLATPDIAIDPAAEGVESAMPFKLDGDGMEIEIDGRSWWLEKV